MEFTRLTIAGSRRKADLVLPDDAPVHALLPEILDLLDEPPARSAFALTTQVGARVDLDRSLDEQDVRHGTMLRLVEIDEAPQPPEVIEVTEAVAEASATRADRWQPRHAAMAAFAAAALLGLAAGTAMQAAWQPEPWIAWIAVGTVSVIGALLARWGRVTGAWAAAGTTIGLGAVVANVAALGSGVPFALPALVLAVAWGVVLVVAGLGARQRAAIVGAALAITTLGACWIAHSAGASVLAIAAVAGIATTLVVASLPAIALASSGLAGFDDRVIGGERIARAEVESSIDAAFATLGWSSAALGIPASAAAAVLALDGDPWALALAATIVIVLVLRSRLFPSGVQRLVLLLCALVPPVLWLLLGVVLGAEQLAWVTLVAAVAVVAIACARPAPVVLARLRRAAQVLETIAVVAMLPALLGLLGIYADLLEAFA